MTSVSVLVPFQPDPNQRGRKVPLADGASREDIFSWVRARWEAFYPSFELVTAGSGNRAINRSAARNEAFRRSSGDVVIVADADIVFHHANVDVALQHMKNGKRWVVGFDRYEQMDGPDTRKVLASDPADPVDRPAKPRWSTDQGNAGLLIMTRGAFVEVGGYDERFTGWGWEDWAIANALHTLAHPMVTVPGYVLHLRHPPSQGRRRDKQRMKPLFDPYDTAFGNPTAMRAVIDDPDRRGL